MRGHPFALGVSFVVAAVVLGFAVPGASGREARTTLRLERIATGLSSPVHVAAAPGDRGALYVVEKGGRIVRLEGGNETVFLDIRSQVSAGGERGLLSVAFHPRYATNRRLYVYYTDTRGDTRVVEFRSDGRRALLTTARHLLFIRQPYPNHNGGQLQFGPDGYLYTATGDGGSGGDPEDRAQNLRSRLGKLLRLNVNRRGARWQTIGYGLRNPWRFSFDRRTGDLYIGDVGQSAWEEVNFTPRRSPGLENYGWDAYEGRARFEPKRPNPAGRLKFPIAVYPLAGGHCAVTGGFVYRGSAAPAARGRYFYGDYCSGRIWSLRVVRGRATSVRVERFRVGSVSSFGEDARGELYVVSLEGSLYRVGR